MMLPRPIGQLDRQCGRTLALALGLRLIKPARGFTTTRSKSVSTLAGKLGATPCCVPMRFSLSLPGLTTKQHHSPATSYESLTLANTKLESQESPCNTIQQSQRGKTNR
ncbi:hypothetical protein GGI43DRAFT_393085 [Trichoderma evansii]